MANQTQIKPGDFVEVMILNTLIADGVVLTVDGDTLTLRDAGGWRMTALVSTCHVVTSGGAL